MCFQADIARLLVKQGMTVVLIVLTMKCAVTSFSRFSCAPSSPSNPTLADLREDVFQNMLRDAVMRTKATKRSRVRVSGLLTSWFAEVFIA